MGKESSRDSVMVCEVLVLWERRPQGIVFAMTKMSVSIACGIDGTSVLCRSECCNTHSFGHNKEAENKTDDSTHGYYLLSPSLGIVNLNNQVYIWKSVTGKRTLLDNEAIVLS